MREYPAKLKVGSDGKGLIYVFEVEGLPKIHEIPLKRIDGFTRLAVYSKEVLHDADA